MSFHNWFILFSIISPGSSTLSQKAEFPSFLRMNSVSLYLYANFFLYSSLNGHLGRLLSCLGNCDWCCNGHRSANTSSKSWLQFPWIYTPKQDCWIMYNSSTFNFLRNFHSAYYNCYAFYQTAFTFLPRMYKGSNFPISSAFVNFYLFIFCNRHTISPCSFDLSLSDT